MAGEGRTVKEAKQDAARKIEAFLALNHQPKTVSWNGTTFIAWNTPQGIVSSYLHADSIGLSGTCHHASADMDKVLQDARLNLAQNSADVSSDIIPEIIRNDVYAVTEFVSWLGFQRAYRNARDTQGLPEANCHEWACHNAQTFAPRHLLAA